MKLCNNKRNFNKNKDLKYKIMNMMNLMNFGSEWLKGWAGLVLSIFELAFGLGQTFQIIIAFNYNKTLNQIFSLYYFRIKVLFFGGASLTCGLLKAYFLGLSQAPLQIGMACEPIYGPISQKNFFFSKESIKLEEQEFFLSQ